MNHKTPQFLLRHRSWVTAIFQACLVAFSLFFAWLLRFDFSLPYRSIFWQGAIVLLLVRVPVMAYFGLLRGWWKYVGVRDGIDVLKAVVTGSVIFWIAMRYLLGNTGFPRTIYVMEGILTATSLVGVRLLSRALAESVRRNRSLGKSVLIIGAGAGAQTILREIRRTGSGYVAVGCLDDDASKRGIRIHDVPVLGYGRAAAKGSFSLSCGRNTDRGSIR